MKKIIVVLLVLIFVFVLPAALKAGSLQTSMIPENTRWLLHLDMQKFSATQVCKALLGVDTKFAKANKEIAEKIGIDLLKDIYGITIFGTENGKENAVVCCAGKLNKTHILALLAKADKHKEIPFGKYTIHNWDGSQFGVFADDNLLLAAKSESALKDTLDVLARKKKDMSKTKLMSYLKDVPGDVFFEIVVDNISSLVGEHKPAILQKTGMALFLALEKNDYLKLKLKMAADTVDTAKNIEQIARGLIAMVKLNQQEKTGTTNKPGLQKLQILENLQIAVKENVLEMELSHPTSELLKMITGAKKGVNPF